METPAPSYHREFAKSPQHAALGLLTLGLGFLSANVLGLIAGVTAYSLGWIYLPDFKFFKNWVDRRHAKTQEALDREKVMEFLQRRDALIASLSTPRQQRYARLSGVCRDIEAAGKDNLQAS